MLIVQLTTASRLKGNHEDSYGSLPKSPVYGMFILRSSKHLVVKSNDFAQVPTGVEIREVYDDYKTVDKSKWSIRVEPYTTLPKGRDLTDTGFWLESVTIPCTHVGEIFLKVYNINGRKDYAIINEGDPIAKALLVSIDWVTEWRLKEGTAVDDF